MISYSYRWETYPRTDGIVIRRGGIVLAIIPPSGNWQNDETHRSAEERAQLFMRAIELADAGAPIGEDL